MGGVINPFTAMGPAWYDWYFLLTVDTSTVDMSAEDLESVIGCGLENLSICKIVSNVNIYRPSCGTAST